MVVVILTAVVVGLLVYSSKRVRKRRARKRVRTFSFRFYLGPNSLCYICL